MAATERSPWGRTNERGRRIVFAAIVATLLSAPLAAQAVTANSAERSAVPTDRSYVEIECGGYDEDGNLIHEAATRIERAPVDIHGVPDIPAICGGYTEDGTFVGDE
jgi:hypothetical protein